MTDPAPSLLRRIGGALALVAKKVLSRGLAWGAFGFMLGLGIAPLSSAIVFFTLDRGAAILWPLVVLPFVFPFVGGALFGVHGLHRGVARAALALEAQFGLVSHVVGRVTAFLEERIGAPVADVPLDVLEGHVKAVVDRYLGSDDLREGEGLSGWVLRKAKRAVVSRVETYTLAAYRAERGDAGGGGVALSKVSARVTAEISERLEGLVMGPLKKQFWILLAAFVVVGLGWFRAGLFIVGLFVKQH